VRPRTRLRHRAAAVRPALRRRRPPGSPSATTPPTWPSAWRSSGGSAWRSPALRRSQLRGLFERIRSGHRRHPDEHVDPGRLGYGAGRAGTAWSTSTRPRRARRDGPGGSCPTVGVAGLALGGGIGVVSRAYGTLSDNLESVQMVTPDARYASATRSSIQTLLACRGAGGRQLRRRHGVHVHPAPGPADGAVFLNWPWSKAARVITAGSPGAHRARRTVVQPARPQQRHRRHPTSRSAARTSVRSAAAAADLPAGGPGRVDPQGTPFVSSHPHAMMIEAGCAQLTTAQCICPGKTRRRAEPRGGVRQVAHLHPRALPAAVSRIIAAVGRRSSSPAAARAAWPRRARRRGQSGRSGRDRVRAPRRPVRRAVHHHLERRRTGVGDQRATELAARLPPDDDAYASGRAYQNYLDPS